MRIEVTELGWREGRMDILRSLPRHGQPCSENAEEELQPHLLSPNVYKIEQFSGDLIVRTPASNETSDRFTT